MEKVTITKEILEKASDYIPLMEKKRLSEELAQKCIATVKMHANVGATGENMTIPERCQEQREMISMYQMGVFAKCYLHMEYAGDIDLQMAANEYDNWAGSHVMNQMEKWKTDKDLKDKVFNILYDFKEFQWALRREIETLIGHNNDVVARIAILLADSVSGGILASAQSLEKGDDKSGEDDATEDIDIKQIKDAMEKIRNMKEAQKLLNDANAELDEAKKLSEERRAKVTKMADFIKLGADAKTEAGYNVRADK